MSSSSPPFFLSSFCRFLVLLSWTVLIPNPADAQPAAAPIAGPNVNLVAGTTWPDGDPYLERQNEPSCAVSTRDPKKLLCGSNDYSTVPLSFDITGVTGDAWQRYYMSADGGQTWRSRLLPGCPYNVDQCNIGPLIKARNLEAAADPTVRAGSNGLFYYSFIAFNRDEKDGVMALSVLIDDNNAESVLTPPVRHVRQTIVADGNFGRFNDKPWMAVDIPRSTVPNCTIPDAAGANLPSFATGNVYVGFSVLQGSDINTRAKVYVATSTDCGQNFSRRIKVSEGSPIAQGNTIAIAPNGDVYLAWRQFKLTDNQPDAIFLVKSIDRGQTFTKPIQVTAAGFTPFDQGTSGVSFRTNAFPAMAVDSNGRVYIAVAERVGPPDPLSGQKDSRIVLYSSPDGTNWSAPAVVVDPIPAISPYNLGARGHQFYPSLAIVAGKITVGYFDSRDDHTAGRLECTFPPCTHTGQFQEVRYPFGELLTNPGLVFNNFLADAQPPGFSVPLPQRRHTIDVRVAQAEQPPPGFAPSFTSTRVSQFPYGSGSPPGTSQAQRPIQQLRFEVPNLPMFAQGTKPFIGDYTDLAALSMISSPNPGWLFNTAPANSEPFYLTWTSNRDVRPPLDGNWAGSYPMAQCSSPGYGPGRTGMRNQNIYAARIDRGLVAYALQNSKPLSPTLKRAFSVVVRNTKNEIKSYQMTIDQQPPGGTASFLPAATPPCPALLTIIHVKVAPRSSVARSVFVTSSERRARVPISIKEIAAPSSACPPPDNPLAGGLQTTVVLNTDLTNTDLTNTDLTNTDLTNTDITNAEAYNTDLTNTDLTNTDLTNTDLTNTDLTNTDLTNTDLTNTDLTNTDLTNTDLTNIGTPSTDLTNTDLTNTDLTNTDLTNTVVANGNVVDATWKVMNRGNTATSINVKNLLKNGNLPAGFKAQLILHKSYRTPTTNLGDCNLNEVTQTVLIANIPNPTFLNPATVTTTDLTNTDLTNTDLTNATMALAPGETGKITLRIIDPVKNAGPGICGTFRRLPPDYKTVQVVPCGPNDFNPSQEIQPIPAPQAVNTNGVSPIPLIITTMTLPDGVAGVLYNPTVQAVGGTGARTWSLLGTPPAGLTIGSGTGQLNWASPVTGTHSVTVQVQDSGTGAPGFPPQQSVTRNYTIRVANPLVITTTTLPNGLVGQPYTATLTATGGTLPLAWTISVGSLPLGLSLNPLTGVISGTPTAVGAVSFTVRVTDAANPMQAATQPLSITVGNLGGGFLIFQTQPVNGLQGATLPAVAVAAYDFTMSPLPGVTITLSLANNPGGATLSGGTSALTNASGIATFSTLSINHGGTDYTLMASASGAPSRTSRPFAIQGLSTNLPPLTVGRTFGHTATRLPDGKVLIWGGFGPGGSVLPGPTEEIYDPATNTTVPASASGTGAGRAYHTAVLLQPGVILVSGGVDSSHTPSDMQQFVFYNPVTGKVTTGGGVGPMSARRAFHTATLLGNGKVLLAGGSTGTGLAGAEIFDPQAQTFTSLTLNVPRYKHTATLLGNGKVLIAGGYDTAPLASAEICDLLAAVPSCTVVGNLGVARFGHTATLLGDGRVLITGGITTPSVITNTAEIFDPTTSTFSPVAAPMTATRTGHFATLLPSGKVLIASGSGTGATSLELFDPATSSFSLLAGVNLLNNRDTGEATLLADGRVLFSGCLAPALAATLELFHPIDPPFALAAFSATGSMSTGRAAATATRLPNGKVLVTGGFYTTAPPPPPGTQGLNTAEVYNPTSGTWSPAANTMATPRYYHSATVLPSGKVLICGGYPGFATPPVVDNTCQLYDPVANFFGAVFVMNRARAGHTATLLHNGQVLIAGGINASGGHENTAELYDPFSGTVTLLAATMTMPRVLHTATLLSNAHVLIAGGRNTGGELASAEIFNYNTNTFSAAGSMGVARALHTATLLPTGDVLIAGGYGSPGSSTSAELWVFTSGSFVTKTMAHGRVSHTATLLPTGKVLIAGGSSVPFHGEEIYDAYAGTFTETAALPARRRDAVAALLPNGRVLVAGGELGDPVLSSAALYDPGPWP
jgi:uncharacterized protein YjbI with pentapeptide repeats